MNKDEPIEVFELRQKMKKFNFAKAPLVNIKISLTRNTSLISKLMIVMK